MMCSVMLLLLLVMLLLLMVCDADDSQVLFDALDTNVDDVTIIPVKISQLQ